MVVATSKNITLISYSSIHTHARVCSLYVRSSIDFVKGFALSCFMKIKTTALHMIGGANFAFS